MMIFYEFFFKVYFFKVCFWKKKIHLWKKIGKILDLFFLVINSTNFFSLGNFFQFFYIKNLKKETKKNPGLVILLAILFPNFVMQVKWW